jgi:hypothetical protein
MTATPEEIEQAMGRAREVANSTVRIMAINPDILLTLHAQLAESEQDAEGAIKSQCLALDRRDKAETRVRKLEAALAKYGVHAWNCKTWRRAECNCGFHAALQGDPDEGA